MLSDLSTIDFVQFPWQADWYRQDKAALFAFVQQLGYHIVNINVHSEMFLAERAS